MWRGSKFSYEIVLELRIAPRRKEPPVRIFDSRAHAFDSARKPLETRVAKQPSQRMLLFTKPNACVNDNRAVLLLFIKKEDRTFIVNFQVW